MYRLLLLALFAVACAFAIPGSAAQIFIHPEMQQLPPLPDIQLTLAEVIDIVAEYNIVQEDNPQFCNRYFGTVDPTSNTIAICSKYDLTQRRETVCHEFFHIAYRRRGIETGGDSPYHAAIGMKAQKLFLDLYGLPAPAPVISEQPSAPVQDVP